MISLSTAYSILLSQSLKLKTCKLPLFEAFGKILAYDVLVLRNLPAFSNSAMDGYAVSDLQDCYKLQGSLFAGDKAQEALLPKHCIKIMTGAMIPPNAIAIIPFEQAKLEGEKIIPTHPIKESQHIKFCGEDYKEGETLLLAGERLDFAALSLLASQGINEVSVYEDLKIAIFASGDELKEPWQKAQSHQTYNTNAIAYHAILQNHGFLGDYHGILPDCKEKLGEALKDFERYDIILTSGGASVGEADFFEEILRENGAEILFHGINLKPGRPMLFAKLKESFVFSLPGNPLSGALNLITLVIPTLKKLSGNTNYQSLHIQAKIAEDLNLKDKRSNMILGNFDGEYFSPFKGGKYGSGSLVPLKACNAIAIFDENQAKLKRGEKISILSLSPF